MSHSVVQHYQSINSFSFTCFAHALGHCRCWQASPSSPATDKHPLPLIPRGCPVYLRKATCTGTYRPIFEYSNQCSVWSSVCHKGWLFFFLWNTYVNPNAKQSLGQAAYWPKKDGCCWRTDFYWFCSRLEHQMDKMSATLKKRKIQSSGQACYPCVHLVIW